jgi:hypothetical protein
VLHPLLCEPSRTVMLHDSVMCVLGSNTLLKHSSEILVLSVFWFSVVKMARQVCPLAGITTLHCLFIQQVFINAKTQI